MGKKWVFAALGCVAFGAVVLILYLIANGDAVQTADQPPVIKLPEPRQKGDVSLEQCLFARRSVRAYRDQPLGLAEVGQLLFAAQGITNAAQGFRTAPSAGALYPLEVYIVAGKVEGLAAGIYKYVPTRHELVSIVTGDKRQELAGAALGQQCVTDGAITVVLSAVYHRTMGKYKERGIRYVYIEAGHAGQSVCLQATALGLGIVPVGAFDDGRVKQLMKMPDEEDPLYLLPIGKK